MSVYDILTQHDFPHRFYAYFASQCAKDALSKDKNVDPRSKLAVDVAERFGNGEDFTQAYLQEVVADAAVQAAAYAAYAAANAAYAAAYAANSASAANAAANAAAYAAATYAAAHYKPLLLSLIQTRLTEFERIMIFGA
jgi:hypothetical protein